MLVRSTLLALGTIMRHEHMKKRKNEQHGKEAERMR